MPYLIDGHNLIGALPDIDIDDPDDEAKLLILLRGFVARKRTKCTVIFDHGLPGGASRMSSRSLTVIFASARHTNADALLKRRIRNIRDVKGWTVVSSDREIADAARRQRLRQLTAQEFARELQRPSAPPNAKDADEKPAPSQADVDEFMRLFGADEADE
ncbi:MAG: NYN domain-containing protein [Chloroflexi bacterium]|nr:NYN domain-containing protein [Chloroflexota bacterium]